MADKTYINEFDLDATHIEVALDQLHTQLLTAVDNKGKSLLKSAEIMRYTEQSIRKPDTPYLVTRIVNVTHDNEQNELIIARSVVELVSDVVFQANGAEDVQRLGFRLVQRLWEYLEPTDTTNPDGFDIPFNGEGGKFWGFLTDNDFVSKQRRTVTRLDDSTAPLEGSYYTIPMQYKIEVFPMMSYE